MVMVWLTSAAGSQLASPAWLATTVQVPAATMVTALPLVEDVHADADFVPGNAAV